MRRGWRIGLLVVGVVTVLALSAGGVLLGRAGVARASSPPTCDSSAAKLTVSGTGMATGTPDQLTLTINISETAATAQLALQHDDAKAQSVTAALKARGATPADIQTANFTISPQYNSAGAVSGYQVNNSLTAKLHDLATAGTAIDSVSAAGGNAVQIQGLSVSVEDTRGLEDQARSAAVTQADAHAQAMAGAAGERLARVCSLTDNTNTPVTYNQFGSASGAASGGLSAQASAPIEAGVEQISAQVTEVFALAAQ